MTSILVTVAQTQLSCVEFKKTPWAVVASSCGKSPPAFGKSSRECAGRLLFPDELYAFMGDIICDEQIIVLKRNVLT
jgi:hypothetical protein